MTPIGAALLALLVGSPDDWEYRHHCDGLRHRTLPILVGPLIADQVMLMVDGEHVRVLSPEDHAAIYRQTATMIEVRKIDVTAQQHKRLAELLGITTPENP